MSENITRRSVLGPTRRGPTAALTASAAKTAKAAVQTVFVSSGAPKGYDPFKHKWLMAIDINKCIGCGLCVEACKKENHVPEGPYFRTWIERSTSFPSPRPAPSKRGAKPSSIRPMAACMDSRNARSRRTRSSIPFSFPNCAIFARTRRASKCARSASAFDSPDGAVLIDPNYCIGCGFCIQACPYGCRFLSPVTKTAEKCTLCYHRITRGLKPACVDICPSEARIFGDLKNPTPDDPIKKFYENNVVQVLKPHLGTEPRVLYAGMDKEVR